MACSLPTPFPRLLSGLLAGILLASTACGSGPKVYPVKGKVVNKGRGHLRDLVGYNVQFQSVSDPREMPGGTIEQDGTFTLYTRWGGKVVEGAKEGSYRVSLLPPVLEGRDPPPLIIPALYTRFETSNLQYEIKRGNNDITIEVERDTH